MGVVRPRRWEPVRVLLFRTLVSRLRVLGLFLLKDINRFGEVTPFLPRFLSLTHLFLLSDLAADTFQLQVQSDFDDEISALLARVQSRLLILRVLIARAGEMQNSGARLIANRYIAEYSSLIQLFEDTIDSLHASD